ncbi:hypothetical protein OJ253_1204 [Cryptosporidium canis]|uniref:Uncharacterized protein n=1 Tax=Cryptosporidium canis TaxID=195482 RepID=A0A9D5DHH6_9CRYT|nr:hypothetical protein OJ253_1204 [Cryptosporidium canis]
MNIPMSFVDQCNSIKMIFQNENTNLNDTIANYGANSTKLSSMLSEMTEKAAKVRTLLEKKQRNEEICSMISSSNELSILNSIKTDIIRANRETFSKMVDVIEAKILDLKENNEKCMNVHFDRSIQTNIEAIKINSTKTIDEILLSITKNSELNTIDKLLNSILLEHRNDIKGSIAGILDLMNQKENKIFHDISELIKEQNNKGASILSSQLNIIQRQYELIIRDLRRRNTFLERDMEAKQVREKKLYEQIMSMDNEAKEAIIVLEEKDFKINFLNSQIKQLQDENRELRDKNLNLFDRNNEITIEYSNKYISLKNRYLSIGLDILQDVFNNLVSRRRKRIFDVFKYYLGAESSDSKTDEITSIHIDDFTKYNYATTQILIRARKGAMLD